MIPGDFWYFAGTLVRVRKYQDRPVKVCSTYRFVILIGKWETWLGRLVDEICCECRWFSLDLWVQLAT